MADTVEFCARHWDLQLDAPFDPGGECSWTAPAGDVVLKVGWRHPEAECEGAGLAFWAGNGTVLLRDEWVTPTTRALLLERCRPGTWLLAALPAREQDEVLAGLLKRLWRNVPADPGFPTLASMCHAWADQARARQSADQDRSLTEDALALFRDLPTTSPEVRLLCTDLHAMNVLAAQREPWLVVDPKPHVGDPHYDVLQHLLNDVERLEAEPLAWINRMADLCDLDRFRVRAWAFARLALEGLRDPRLAAVARRIAI